MKAVCRTTSECMSKCTCYRCKPHQTTIKVRLIKRKSKQEDQHA